VVGVFNVDVKLGLVLDVDDDAIVVAVRAKKTVTKKGM
jgi:hypothetical protein